MAVFLVSFVHPRHNIQAQAQVVAVHASNAKALFRIAFNEHVFGAHAHPSSDIKAFWDDVEFTVIDLFLSPVFNFGWERKDPKDMRFFKALPSM